VAVLTNTILAGNTTGIQVTPGNTATLQATLWGDNEWANGQAWAGDGTIITGTLNIWGPPAFQDADGGDYHITATSAALDIAGAWLPSASDEGKPSGSTAVVLGSYGMSGRERQRKREPWLLLWQIIQHLL
jgi:hypothetical protein